LHPLASFSKVYGCVGALPFAMPRIGSGRKIEMQPQPETSGRDNLRPLLGSSDFAQSIRREIDIEGYVVLPGIFSQQEANREYDRMWDWVETVSPGICRADASSWRPVGGEDVWPCSQRDMMQLHQAGWVFNDMRVAMAERVFEKIYGTTELHCSKDGFTLQRPTKRELGRSPNDHYDQGFGQRGLQCIQASIALTDQEHDDGCFLCWPGSHKLHDKIMDWRGSGGARQDFVILKDKEKEYLQSKGFEPKRVPVKRGDVILWRSDLAHKGAPPIGSRENFRGVVYVCMLPAIMTPEHVWKDKQKGYQQLQSSCHWPNREEWFRPRQQNIDVRPYFQQPPRLTLRQQQLYGLVRYSGPSPGVPLAASDEADANATCSNVNTTDAAQGAALDDVKVALPSRNERINQTTANGGTADAARRPRRWERALAPQAEIADGRPQVTKSVDEAEDPERIVETRRLQKALKEIEILEERLGNGETLRGNQMKKVGKKSRYRQDLLGLEPPAKTQCGV